MRKVFKVTLWILVSFLLLINIVVAIHAYKYTHYYDPPKGHGLKKSSRVTFSDVLFGLHFYRKPDNILPDTAFETVYLSTNGLKLQGWMVKAQSPKGTIVMFHGHGGNKSDILEEAKQFRKLGFNTFLLDFRAHGNSEGHTCTIGYDEAEDVRMAYNYVREKGEKHIILWGISLGAASITRAISSLHIFPEKVILELPFGSLVKAVEAKIKMMNLPAEPLASMLTFWGGAEHGFWAFGNCPSEYVKDIHCPVLLELGALDKRVTKSEGEEIYKNISAPKNEVIYEHAGHESLYKNEPAKWTREVSSFLNQ